VLPHAAVDERGRPIIDAALTLLIGEMARSSPRLTEVDASRILIVYGQARLESRASIRPLTFGGDPLRDGDGPWMKPEITIGGTRMLYEICLRPRFFLDATSEERAMILAHELWHTSAAFDGTLEAARRHQQIDGDRIEREVGEIVDSWRRRGGAGGSVLAISGELRMRAWLRRPPTRVPRGSSVRLAYGDADLYAALLEQRSRSG
jgi:hypothetical protein